MASAGGLDVGVVGNGDGLAESTGLETGVVVYVSARDVSDGLGVAVIRSAGSDDGRAGVDTASSSVTAGVSKGKLAVGVTDVE